MTPVHDTPRESRRSGSSPGPRLRASHLDTHRAGRWLPGAADTGRYNLLMQRTACLLALLLLTPTAAGQVRESSPDHFVLERSVRLAAAPAEVWGALVRIDEWWSPDHTYSGDSSRLSLSAAPGGCFCETLPAGGFVEHMRVVYAEPNVMLRMTGGLGPLQEYAVSGSMTWSFEADGNSTVLTVRYRVTGAGGLDQWSEPVDGVLAEQLSRLRALIGDPPAAP